jgi:CRISPR-associated protein Cas2
MSGLYLLCYDIANDGRLRRVAAIAEKYGVRLQYSVFLLKVTPNTLNRLIQELKRAIHPREDDIRIYPLPADPSWEMQGRALWPEGIRLSGKWPVAEDTPSQDRNVDET